MLKRLRDRLALNEITAPMATRRQGKKLLIAGLVVAVYMAVITIIEVFFLPEKNRALEVLHLTGLGLFAWIFLAIVLRAEWIRNCYEVWLEKTRQAALEVAHNRAINQEAAEYLCQFYEEECEGDRVLRVMAPSRESFLKLLVKPDSKLPLNTFLSRRAKRLEKAILDISAVLKQVAGQLGLLCSVIGIMGALIARNIAAKVADLTPGMYIALTGSNKMAFALTTTAAGCIAILYVIWRYAAVIKNAAALLRELATLRDLLPDEVPLDLTEEEEEDDDDLYVDDSEDWDDSQEPWGESGEGPTHSGDNGVSQGQHAGASWEGE